MRRLYALLMGLCVLLGGCVPGRPAAEPEPTRLTASPSVPAASVPSPSPTPRPTAAETPTATLEPTPVPTPTPNPIRALAEELTDRELIGQLVMIGVLCPEADGVTDPRRITQAYQEFITQYQVGNIMLFGWNIQGFDDCTALTELLQSLRPQENIPMGIGLDVEGGAVRRFSWSPRLLSAQELGELDDPQTAYDQFARIGRSLADAGVTLDFAPVLDIAPDPDATFLGSRMFGSDPSSVSRLAAEAIRGLHAGGCAAVGKHFPGHGNTATDSHEALPVIQESREELERYALIPFQSAIEAGVDAMLVGHLSFPALDGENIASVSPVIITGLLREDMGFDGVVVSDDMRMQGLTSQMSVGEGAVRFLEAGGDLVLIGKGMDNQKAVFTALYQALEEGRLTRERLLESVVRVLRMKLR